MLRRPTVSAAIAWRFRMDACQPGPGARSAPLKLYVEQVLTGRMGATGLPGLPGLKLYVEQVLTGRMGATGLPGLPGLSDLGISIGAR